ncbi:hypothetical protein JP0524_05060 [Helicobacter pylori]|nr:hypothetical protein JP0524_05060 [Helicobacter pylori]
MLNENSLIPLINNLKEKKKEISHSLVLSKMSLGAVIKLIFFYKLESSVLDLQQLSFKKYYKDNRDVLLIRGKKNKVSITMLRFISL